MKKVLSVVLVLAVLLGVVAAVSAEDKSFYQRALDGEFKGATVVFDGPFVDQDQVFFESSIKDFEDKTGITVKYIGNKDFESSIQMRVEGGNMPDIADFAQPGLIGELAKKGYIVDARDVISEDWLKQNYTQAWLDLAMMPGSDGKDMMAGIWARYNAKSQVYYRPQVWADAGYKVPTTWDEMVALSKQMVEDGETPWCVGIESGAATGWPATDWVEDIMLRTVTPEQYDQWTKGELKFDSPEVRNAIDIMSNIWFTDGFVLGGRQAIASTNFGDSVHPLFQDKDGCMMHRMGNFITAYFPEGMEPGKDYDVFYLPPIDDKHGNPYLVAGDIYGLFKNEKTGQPTDAAKAVYEFFTHGESLKFWLGQGGALAPQNDADAAWYKNPTDAKIAGFVANASVFRFDGSDLMPAAVGSGTFWKGMTDLVTGSSVDDVVKEIDAGWSAK